jgi:hypothetical protein
VKSIFLSVVVICALAIAGIGSTLADFSDSEEELGDTLQAGSMDLKVSTGGFVGGKWVSDAEYDDLPWGQGVPALVYAIDIEPDKSRDFTFDLHNAGQPEGDLCWVYLHVKKVMCEDVPPHKDGIVCPGGKLQPEPEVVAEHGGMVGQTQVPGVGCCFGCNGELEQHIDFAIWYDADADEIFEDNELVYDGKLDGIICKNTLLGELPKCNMRLVHVVVNLQDIDEDDLIAAGVIPDPGTGYGYFDETDPDVQQKCWDHWPSNALMKDKITFNILFSLVE